MEIRMRIYSKTPILQSRCSRLVLVLLGSLFITGLTSCSRPEVVEKLSSPDGQQNYNCDKERKDFGSIECKTHWCWIFTQQTLVEELKSMRGVGWRPCYVRADKTNQSSSGPAGFVNAGGVAWFWWNKGQVGDLVLKRFAVHDYRQVNGFNDTIYGDAIRQKDRKYCYDVKWSGKYWGTYCMVPMKEAASFLN